MRNVIFVRFDNCIFRSFRILEGLFWGILIFCNLMIASDVFADTWFVNASAVGDNNGTSWANAYTDIQTAIGAASEEDEIWVAAGTYTSTRDNVIKIKSKHGVALYGGFDGTENQRNERDPAVNTTTIDGEGARRGIHITSSTDIIFDGFTITNGHIISKGGGLYNDGIHGIIKNITINNCIFSGNHTDGVGGGVCNEYGNPTVSNCIFRGNSADYGGGIYNRSNDESIIINCSFSGNSAEDGGGMFNDSTSPTVSNCFFIGNSAQDGGGMNNFSASRRSATVFSLEIQPKTAEACLMIGAPRRSATVLSLGIPPKTAEACLMIGTPRRSATALSLGIQPTTAAVCLITNVGACHLRWLVTVPSVRIPPPTPEAECMMTHLE